MRPRLDVLLVDNHVLAVSKPAGLLVAPDASGDPSLLDLAREWIRVEFAKPGDVFLGLVHRLDRPVSGVVVFGRTSKGASRLSESFRERRAEKTYWGVVPHAPRGASGVIEHWLAKDEARNVVRVVAADTVGAQHAVTRWRTLEVVAGRALLELTPETGRPHQLRAACAALGTPLLGDLKYGAREPLSDATVALHARSLRVPHPTRPEFLDLVARPPGLPVWEFDATR